MSIKSYYGSSRNWGTDYLGRHTSEFNINLKVIVDKKSCSHSDSPYDANLNYALKGQAARYMFAKLVDTDNDLSNGC